MSGERLPQEKMYLGKGTKSFWGAILGIFLLFLFVLVLFVFKGNLFLSFFLFTFKDGRRAVLGKVRYAINT